MRLVSFRPVAGGSANPWQAGLVNDGAIVGLSANGQALSVRDVLALEPEQRAQLASSASDGAPGWARDAVSLGPPVPDPDKILCIGLNYVDHASETQLEAPPVPTVFAKFRNSLCASGDPIVVPAAATQVDYEGELAVVIGRRCARVAASNALAYVGGVMPLNDVTARDLQFQTPQWTAGKAVDSFAPCGPELVLLDEIADLQALRIQTRVNGVAVQDATTADMIFGVAEIVAFLSSFMTLETGDIVATGTPAGVGFTREPPLWLRPGDYVEVDINGVGCLSNTVMGE